MFVLKQKTFQPRVESGTVNANNDAIENGEKLSDAFNYSLIQHNTPEDCITR